MNAHVRQYVFGGILLAFAIYQITRMDWVEVSLYGCAGLAFVLNALTLETKLAPFKKPLVVVAWTFIILTALLFFYVIQFKF